MIKIKLLLFLLFGTFSSYSQEAFISGIVIDQDQKPIAYTNIVDLNKKAGTFSGENGKFNLMLSDLLDSDIIEFSCLGYITKQIPVEELKKVNAKVSLIEAVEKLDEVVLSSKKSKTYVKGKTRTNTSDMMRFSSSFKESVWNEPEHEIGRKFTLGTKKTSYLKEFSFYIKKNTFQNIILEINIYNIKDNKPFQNINPSSIIVTVDNEHIGWKTVDLLDFYIHVKEDIIITVEYIKAEPNCYERPGNCGLFFPYIYPTIFTPPMYTKNGIQDEWQIRKGESITMILTYQK
jgi:hypothetical protein